MNDPLLDLSNAGVSVWLDDLSRVRLNSGSLQTLVRDWHVVGVTSNPTIFAKALAGANTYDGQLSDLTRLGASVDEALRQLTTYDVRWACDVLRATYDATGGVDGRVSIEVDARLAHDTEGTIAQARQLWWLVDRPNLFVKIPATLEGLPAITQCLAEGISVNVTLIFSLSRYAQVFEAYLEGMERAHAASRDLRTLASVASFFVSRVDTEIDSRLDSIGTDEAAALKGKAALANARLAYRHFEEAFDGERALRLLSAGARPQRPLWASTGVKNPAYPDTMYVTGLVAPDVVNTMPEVTLRAVADHGVVAADTVRSTYPESQAVLDNLAALGIDYAEATTRLEEQGLTTFQASWASAANELNQRMKAETR